MERTESNCVTVKFVDCWPTCDVEHNKFVDALRSKYLVTVLPTDGDEVPDLLFYSRCGNGRHLSYDCIRIYFTGENDCPDFNECDYALSFYPLTLGDRHLRYPLYMLYEYDRLGTPETVSDSDALGRGFCSLLMRNATNCDPRRLEIIDCMELSETMPADASTRRYRLFPVLNSIWRLKTVWWRDMSPKRFSSLWWLLRCLYTGATIP